MHSSMVPELHVHTYSLARSMHMSACLNSMCKCMRVPRSKWGDQQRLLHKAHAGHKPLVPHSATPHLGTRMHMSTTS